MRSHGVNEETIELKGKYLVRNDQAFWHSLKVKPIFIFSQTWLGVGNHEHIFSSRLEIGDDVGQ